MSEGQVTTKSKRRKDILQWWLDRIKVLKEKADELYEQDKTVYKVGPQAVSKLAILAYYIDIYTRIMKKHSRTICYLDLFAGCGLCRVKKVNVNILGSATLAYYIPEQGYKFDKIILFEKEQKYVDVLKKRIPTAQVFKGDVNEVLNNDMIGELCGNNTPFLAFVDPEGLELSWETLEKILSRWSDVIINYHPDAVRRVYGLKHDESYKERLNRFFGTEEWQNIKYEDERYLQLYINRIKKVKNIAEYIMVRGKGNYYYYIILATRRTMGNNPWLSAFRNLKQRIEDVSGNIIEQLFNIYIGKQKTFSTDNE